MITIREGDVLLSASEYFELTNPDTTYTMMTKTAAKSAVKTLLKSEGFTCYHDRQPILGSIDGCCSMCPVMVKLGHDAGNRMCTRGKWWSK